MLFCSVLTEMVLITKTVSITHLTFIGLEVKHHRSQLAEEKIGVQTSQVRWQPHTGDK